MSVRWPTPNVPADTAGGAVVVVGSGTLDSVVGRARVPVPPPPHAARIATTAVVVTASVGRLGRPGRARALIRTESMSARRRRSDTTFNEHQRAGAYSPACPGHSKRRER